MRGGAGLIVWDVGTHIPLNEAMWWHVSLLEVNLDSPPACYLMVLDLSTGSRACSRGHKQVGVVQGD